MTRIISIDMKGFRVSVPDPAVFALHKLIIMSRRRTKEKREKDKKQAKSILSYLMKKGREKDIREAICLMHPKWFKTVLSNLKREGEEELHQELTRIASL